MCDANQSDGGRLTDKVLALPPASVVTGTGRRGRGLVRQLTGGGIAGVAVVEQQLNDPAPASCQTAHHTVLCTDL